jgi:primosomal protein N' (replication factor Y)
VYLRAIAACRARNRGALVLVPEIALTPQLIARFRARFGDDVAVLHSGLSDRDRHAMWKRLRRGELEVAIGARSALFAPVCNLGLVVVDEEHDGSFKQEEGTRYHARDMALLRAHRAGATAVLGSATPSLESEMLVRRGMISRLTLPDRAHQQAVLPKVA